MRKHLLLAILISLINPLLVAANLQSGAGNVSGTQNSTVTGKLQPAEAQADFDLMRQTLSSRDHPESLDGVATHALANIYLRQAR